MSASLGGMLLLGLAAVFFIGLLAVGARKPKKDEPPPPPSRTSFLAFLSFLCGLGSVVCLAASAILALCVDAGELLEINDRERQALRLAERVAIYACLAPAVAALAFWIAARGAIKEARGGVRGVALYRAGVIMALVSGFIALYGQGAGLAASATRPGYLGVQVERLPAAEARKAGRPGVRIVGVLEGTPAFQAGFRPGLVIEQIDGRPVASETELRDVVSSHPAGSEVTVQVRSGDVVTLTTVRLIEQPEE